MLFQFEFDLLLNPLKEMLATVRSTKDGIVYPRLIGSQPIDSDFKNKMKTLVGGLYDSFDPVMTTLVRPLPERFIPQNIPANQKAFAILHPTFEEIAGKMQIETLLGHIIDRMLLILDDDRINKMDSKPAVGGLYNDFSALETLLVKLIARLELLEMAYKAASVCYVPPSSQKMVEDFLGGERVTYERAAQFFPKNPEFRPTPEYTEFVHVMRAIPSEDLLILLDKHFSSDAPLDYEKPMTKDYDMPIEGCKQSLIQMINSYKKSQESDLNPSPEL